MEETKDPKLIHKLKESARRDQANHFFEDIECDIPMYAQIATGMLEPDKQSSSHHNMIVQTHRQTSHISACRRTLRLLLCPASEPLEPTETRWPKMQLCWL